MLTLFEALFLLAIHEDKGIIISSLADSLPTSLGGAILAELALTRKIGLKDNQRLELLDASPTDDDILTEALEKFATAEKERKIGYWIDIFSQKPEKLRKRLAKRLAQKELVAQEDDRLTWVIPASTSSGQNASAKYMMKDRMRTLVLTAAQAEQREIALLSLIKASGLLDLIFVKDERKLADRRIHELVVGEALKDPAIQTIETIAAAIESIVEED